MTQEDKELLLKDLCSRLPYKVKGKDCDGNTREMVVIYPTGTIIARTLDDKSCAGCGFIPYLRPMSSMTEEEIKEFNKFGCGDNDVEEFFDLIDWFNKKMFDYRGLIEKGLAIEAPKNIYK